MSIQISFATAAFALSLGAIASPASAQSYTAPASILVAAAPGGLQHTHSYDDITTGSISMVRGGQLSVRLPELRTDDGYKPGAARHYGPRGEPLAY